MKFDHPSIVLEQPAPGHYVIRGHNPSPVPTEKGTLVPLTEIYISPEVPSEILAGILADRDYDVNPFGPTDDELKAVVTENDALKEQLATLTKERDEALEKLAAPVTHKKGGK